MTATVLMIEDNVQIRYCATDLLLQHGFSVGKAVADGCDEAIEKSFDPQIFVTGISASLAAAEAVAVAGATR